MAHKPSYLAHKGYFFSLRIIEFDNPDFPPICIQISLQFVSKFSQNTASKMPSRVMASRALSGRLPTNLPKSAILSKCIGQDLLRIETDDYDVNVTDPQTHFQFTAMCKKIINEEDLRRLFDMGSVNGGC